MTAPAAPTFSPGYDAGETYATFATSISVTITGSGNVYYTTDESDPRIDGALYASALTFTQNTTLKAVAINSNTIGPVASQDFILRG